MYLVCQRPSVVSLLLTPAAGTQPPASGHAQWCTVIAACLGPQHQALVCLSQADVLVRHSAACLGPRCQALDW